MKTFRRIIPALLVIALLLSSATFAFASGTVSFVTTGSAYMRKAPNLDGKKITVLPKGTAFNATDAEKDERGVTWYFGSYDGKTGWVSEKNMKKTSGNPTEKASEKITLVTTAVAYMRKAPNLDGEKIATLKKGSKLIATEYEKDNRGVKWYYGTCNKKTGWVSEKNLEKVSDKPTPKPTPKPIDYSKFKDAGYYVVVTASSLNMRKEPSSEYAVIDSYKEGTVLYALRSNGSWAEVKDEDTGRKGYMSEKYLEKYVEPAVQGTENFAAETEAFSAQTDLFATDAEPADLSLDGLDAVEPMPVMINLFAPEDGIYPVSFLPEDLVELEGIITLQNVHLYTQDTYDIVDIAQLAVGDTIIIDGTPVKVEKIERGDFVMINGGIDEGGWNLRAEDESNCFVVWDLDDATTYTDHGMVTLPLGGTVVYTDDSDLDNHVEANIENIFEAINSEDSYGYSPYNTMIRIESGMIMEIARTYMP